MNIIVSTESPSVLEQELHASARAGLEVVLLDHAGADTNSTNLHNFESLRCSIIQIFAEIFFYAIMLSISSTKVLIRDFCS